MAAYLYVDIEVSDPAAYEDYRRQAPALIAAHDGRYLVRGGAARALEGNHVPHRQVILEFPDMAHLQAFYVGKRSIRSEAARAARMAVSDQTHS